MLPVLGCTWDQVQLPVWPTAEQIIERVGHLGVRWWRTASTVETTDPRPGTRPTAKHERNTMPYEITQTDPVDGTTKTVVADTIEQGQQELDRQIAGDDLDEQTGDAL